LRKEKKLTQLQLAERLKVLRVHGCRKKYQYEMIGINSRLDALQAAILRVKLRYLQGWSDARQRNADCYRRLFAGFELRDCVGLPTVPPNRVHVYNQFVIRALRRDELREYLRQAGTPTEVYYPSPLHTERAYAYLGYKAGDFPQAEAAARESLALPIFPELTEAQQGTVVGTIADFYRAARD
jgi:dTDP-4-amino-4,6-dideoxygalactose transaminase